MVIWTDNAISNITEFIRGSKEGTEKTAQVYMEKLVDYVEILETLPNIGKQTNYILSNYNVKQIIYKKHKIIYNLKENDIVVLSIIHTRLDITKVLNKLKKDLN